MSPGVFLFFQNVDFQGYQSGNRSKNGPKWQKKFSVKLRISGIRDHMIMIFSTHGQYDDISSKLFHFSKILIFLVIGVKRAKNDHKLPILLCHAPYIKNCRIKNFHTHVENNDISRYFSLFFKKVQYFKY